MSLKKSQFSRNAVFGLVSRICPDLPISAAVCLRIGGQKLAQIFSVYTKKNSCGLTPLGELTTLPQTQSRTPDRQACGARTLQLQSSNYGNLN